MGLYIDDSQFYPKALLYQNEGCFKTDVLSFLARAGHTVEIYVPSGHYYAYFSYGDDWFGPQYVFGPKTAYGMDDELADYTQYSWEYTLIPSVSGNFSETPISADEF